MRQSGSCCTHFASTVLVTVVLKFAVITFPVLLLQGFSPCQGAKLCNCLAYDLHIKITVQISGSVVVSFTKKSLCTGSLFDAAVGMISMPMPGTQV